MLLFNYSCDISFNSLFYFNQNISDKYHYEGDYLFLYTIFNNLTISIISTLSSFIIIQSLNNLTNSKDKIVSIFKKIEKKMKKNKIFKITIKGKRNIYKKLIIVFKCLKKKIVIYMFLEFFILIFFFYYISAFCEVYKETQISWIIDIIISSFLSILTELLISFIIALLYKISIHYKLKILYNIALFIYGL